MILMLSDTKYLLEKLTGCYMLLDEASVTGTANILMTAVMAEGITTIYNAACEPYLAATVQDVECHGSKNNRCWL